MTTPRRIAGAALALALIACSSDDPTTPEAPRRAEFDGEVSLAGVVDSMPLPPASVADGVPLLACYVSSDLEHWLPVAQWPSAQGAPSCFLNLAPSAPRVELINAPPGWRYRVVVLW